MYWKKEGQAELCQGDEFPMTKEKASYSFCLFFTYPVLFMLLKQKEHARGHHSSPTRIILE
jgi:hypothetical protein